MVKALWLALLLVAQDPAFKVSGTVVREDNQEPDRVAGADRVLLRGGATPKVTDIGTGGAFEFTGVRPGTYQVVIGPMVTMEPMPLVVADKDITGLRVVVPNRVAVRGTMTVEDGGPRPRFQLILTRADGPEPQSTPINLTVTGSFSTTITPGDYRVSSSGLPRGYSLKSVISGTTDGLKQPLKIASGSEIEITLGVSSPPPWVRVSGRVTSGNGTGAAASVTINGAASAEALTVPANADGSFEFSRVLPGAYTAFALTPGAVSPPTALTVGANDVSNFAIRIAEPKEISGRIIVQGNVPMPRAAFALAPVAGIPGSGSTLPMSPQPDGSFTISLPQGERQISVLPASIPPGYRLAAFSYGTTDLLKNSLRVAAGDAGELRVTLDASAVTPVNVRGRVVGLLTTQGVRVVLMSPILSSIEAPVNTDGSFAFSKIIPGSYVARLSLSGLSAGSPVTVRNADVNDVVINYPREFVVSGHILVEGDANASPSITLEARDAGGRSTVAMMVNSGVILFTLKDGEYSVAPRNVPAGYQLKSIVYGTTDLLKAPLKIDGPPTWEIIVRLTK